MQQADDIKQEIIEIRKQIKAVTSSEHPEAKKLLIPLKSRHTNLLHDLYLLESNADRYMKAKQIKELIKQIEITVKNNQYNYFAPNGSPIASADILTEIKYLEISASAWVSYFKRACEQLEVYERRLGIVTKANDGLINPSS